MRGPKAPYGLLYNATFDASVIHEPEMLVIERVFRTATSGLSPAPFRPSVTLRVSPQPQVNGCGGARSCEGWWRTTFTCRTPTMRWGSG